MIHNNNLLPVFVSGCSRFFSSRNCVLSVCVFKLNTFMLPGCLVLGISVSSAVQADYVNSGGVLSFTGVESSGIDTVTTSNGGVTTFTDSSSGGQSNMVTSDSGSFLRFSGASNAGSGLLLTSGSAAVEFSGTASAGATTNNVVGAGTTLTFLGNSTAATGIIGLSQQGSLNFKDSATLGSASIFNGSSSNAGSAIQFDGNSTAGDGAISNIYGGQLTFSGSANAGSSRVFNAAGSTTRFEGNSSAANSSILSGDPNSHLIFAGAATAGNSRIDNREDMRFEDNATAGNAVIDNKEANGSIIFSNSSSAGTSVIRNDVVDGGKFPAGANIRFDDTSTAGAATIQNLADGVLTFAGSSNGGSSIITNGGIAPRVVIVDDAQLSGARIINETGASVDVQGVTSSTSIGSLSGSGEVLLGSKTLSVGALALNDTISGTISGTSGVLGKVGVGTLTLTGINTYGGGTALAEGRINVGENSALGTGTLSMGEDTELGFVTDGLTVGNDLILQGANNSIVDSGSFTETLSGVISGVGGLTKTGGGVLVLVGANTYSGNTDIGAGIVRAAAENTLSSGSEYFVSSGAMLDLAGYNQTIAAMDLSGTVRVLGAAPGTKLTVNGAWKGTGGTLQLGTMLGDSNSLSDRLILNGPTAIASGTTNVEIINLNGLGAKTAGNGIEIISAQGGATTTAQTTKDAFRLSGGHVDAGAYEYRLYAADANNSGENWYLRSNSDTGVTSYRAEVPLYSALSSQLRQGNLAMLGDMHKRIGDDDVKNSSSASSDADCRAWMRVISSGMEIKQGGTTSPNSSGRLNGLQVGSDLLVFSNWRAGLYVGQLEGDVNVDGSFGGLSDQRAGSNSLRSRFVGAYGTYTGDSGLYVDAVVQSGHHNFTVEPIYSHGTKGTGDSLLASIEAGKAFPLGTHAMSIEPQLQLIHQNLDLRDSNISGAEVKTNADSNWIARAGVRIKGEINTGVGMLQPYGRFNVYKASNGKDVSRFINGDTTTETSASTGGTSTEIAGGLTLALSESMSIYGEVGKLWSSGGDSAVSSLINGSIGIRMNW